MLLDDHVHANINIIVLSTSKIQIGFDKQFHTNKWREGYPPAPVEHRPGMNPV